MRAQTSPGGRLASWPCAHRSPTPTLAASLARAVMLPLGRRSPANGQLDRSTPSACQGIEFPRFPADWTVLPGLTRPVGESLANREGNSSANGQPSREATPLAKVVFLVPRGPEQDDGLRRGPLIVATTVTTQGLPPRLPRMRGHPRSAEIRSDSPNTGVFPQPDHRVEIILMKSRMCHGVVWPSAPVPRY
jgi:hypothetical protein